MISYSRHKIHKPSKKKLIKQTLSNLKTLALQETLKKIKATDWEKVFSKYVSGKRPITKIHKVLLQLNTKRMKTQIYKAAKDLNRFFTNEDIGIKNSLKCLTFLVIRKIQIIIKRDISKYPLEWRKLKECEAMRFYSTLLNVWRIWTMGYYGATKIKNVLIHTTTSANPTTIMLSKRKQIQWLHTTWVSLHEILQTIMTKGHQRLPGTKGRCRV